MEDRVEPQEQVEERQQQQQQQEELEGREDQQEEVEEHEEEQEAGEREEQQDYGAMDQSVFRAQIEQPHVQVDAGQSDDEMESLVQGQQSLSQNVEDRFTDYRIHERGSDSTSLVSLSMEDLTLEAPVPIVASTPARDLEIAGPVIHEPRLFIPASSHAAVPGDAMPPLPEDSFRSSAPSPAYSSDEEEVTVVPGPCQEGESVRRRGQGSRRGRRVPSFRTRPTLPRKAME